MGENIYEFFFTSTMSIELHRNIRWTIWLCAVSNNQKKKKSNRLLTFSGIMMTIAAFSSPASGGHFA